MTTSTTPCDRCGDATEVGRVKLAVVAGELKADSVDQAVAQKSSALLPCPRLCVDGRISGEP
jgi:hypothetical protein